MFFSKASSSSSSSPEVLSSEVKNSNVPLDKPNGDAKMWLVLATATGVGILLDVQTTDTIFSAKNKLQVQERLFPAAQQEWKVRGKMLSDDKTFGDYIHLISQGTRLYLVQRQVAGEAPFDWEKWLAERKGLQNKVFKPA